MKADQNIPNRAESQLSRLRSIHEVAAAGFAASLAGVLRVPVEVGVLNMEQSNFGRFAGSLTTPACFHVLKAEQFDDRPMLDIELQTIHPMIERMLGGAGDDSPPIDRPLTEIELCLAARVVRMFLSDYCRAWRNVFDLTLDVLQSEHDPRLLHILPPDEPVIVAGFGLKFGQTRGTMRLCLPYRAVEVMLLNSCPDPAATIRSTLAEIRVTLAETQISAAELGDLEVGDIIATETRFDAPANVSIDGTVKFSGKPGVFRGQKAVCLVEPVDNQEKTEPQARP